MPVKIMAATFGENNDVREIHVTVELNDSYVSSRMQFQILESAVRLLAGSSELAGTNLIFKRYFLSDAVNQAQFVTSQNDEAVSVVQQPPLNGTKAALWLYYASGVSLSRNADGSALVKSRNHNHIIHTQLYAAEGDSAEQTRTVFDNYVQSLNRAGCTLKDNAVRTWIFVQDVDIQYAGMVASRSEYFAREELTAKTHYIASTGIEGRYIVPQTLVLMDAYSVSDLSSEQVKYLHATDYLNSPDEYGVTFERGVAIDYSDRRHIFVSGTASINNTGEVVHSLNVEMQTQRVFENITALLSDAGSSMSDVASMIVYLRDVADRDVVLAYLEEHYPAVPRVMVWAPVCRPAWLVEVECVAIK